MTTVSTSPALAEIRQVPPDQLLVAALDIGKDVNVVYLCTGAGRDLLPPTTVATLASGFAQVTVALDAQLSAGGFRLALLGHEPTGIYHEAWRAALSDRYRPYLSGAATPLLRYRLLVPHQVKQERERQGHRRRKTDQIDVRAIATLLADGCGHPVPLLGPVEQHLRLTLGQLRRLEQQQRRLGQELLRTLDRLWPGALGDGRRFAHAHPDRPPLQHLVASAPLERVRVRLLLEHAPDPHQLRQLGPEGIRALFHQHGAACGPVIAQQIWTVLAQSLLPPPAVSAVLAQQVQRSFALYRSYETQRDACEAEALALLPQSSGQVLTSVPGISPLLAARYLAGVGDISCFPSAGHVWSHAGYDPILTQSGNLRISGPISRVGSAYLRGVLYQLGYLASQHNGASARLYVQARQRGLPEVKAVIHVANHLNRVLYALLTRQETYRSPLSADEAAGWVAQAQALRRARRR